MSEEHPTGRPSQGYAVVAGIRLPVVGLHLCKGTIGLWILVPADFPGCDEATMTLFGHDDGGIMVLPEDVNIPASPGSPGVVEIVLQGVPQ